MSEREPAWAEAFDALKAENERLQADSIDCLDLHQAHKSILADRGIRSVDALCALTRRDVLLLPGISHSGLHAIEVALAERGLALRTSRVGLDSLDSQHVIDDLGLPLRITRALRRSGGIENVAQLVARSRTQMLELRGIGDGAVERIEDTLAAHGLAFAPEPECSRSNEWLNTVEDYRREVDELRAENERLRVAIVDFEAALSKHHRGLAGSGRRCAVCEPASDVY